MDFDRWEDYPEPYRKLVEKSPVLRRYFRAQLELMAPLRLGYGFDEARYEELKEALAAALDEYQQEDCIPKALAADFALLGLSLEACAGLYQKEPAVVEKIVEAAHLLSEMIFEKLV